MLDPLAAESAKADIEAAYKVLGDVEKRAAFDRELAGDDPPPAIEDRPAEAETRPPSAVNPPSSTSETMAPTTPPMAVGNASNPPKAALRFLAPVVDDDEEDDEPMSGSAPIARAQPANVTMPPVSAASSAAAALRGPGSGPMVAAPGPGVSSPSVPTAPVAAASTTSPPTGERSGISTAPTLVPAPADDGLLPAEGEIDGTVLKRLREKRGISLEALAEATKIRKPYLMAIEEQDLENLPARVYLRGFLTQVARVLKVDRARLAEGYLSYVERRGRS
jgi:hypothetical protein